MVFKKLFGSDESPAQAPPAPAADTTDDAVRAATDEVAAPDASLDDRLQQLGEHVAAIEAELKQFTPMLRFTAKAQDKSDRTREQQFLDLRGHFTAEIDRLAASLRLDAAKQAAVDVFAAVMPALDDIDIVLAASPADGKEAAALRMVHDKLKAAFARIGVHEIPVEPRETNFDAEIHEGVVYEGADANDLDPDTIVELRRAGYRTDELVIRPAKVAVTSRE